MTLQVHGQRAECGYREHALDGMTLDVEAILASSQLGRTCGVDVEASFLTASDIDHILETCSGRLFDNF